MKEIETRLKGWRETALEAVCSDIISGGTPSTSHKSYYGGDIPWLRTQEVNFNYIYDTAIKITQVGLENSSARWVPADTIIVAMYGNSAGRTAYTKIPLTTNQACCNLIVDKEKADPRFIYFVLLNNYERLENLATGGAQQNLNVGVIKQYKIALPALQEQKGIAAVLSSLDDKIELLRKQNETLEQVAQAMFNEWFVKPIADDVLPKGWTVKGLPDIAVFLNGIALQKYPATDTVDYLPAIKIKELNSGITDATDRINRQIPEKYVIKDGDILFSWSGSLQVVIWQHGEGALNQHLFKVSSEKYPKWFYYLWLLHHLQDFRIIAANKATTMGHIQRHHLDQAEVVVPDEETLKRADILLSPMLNKIILNNAQVRQLSTLRDALLPRLMSGEIRV